MKQHTWMHWGMVAACLAVMGLAIFGNWGYGWLLILCPLLHIWMMYGMNKEGHDKEGHGSHGKNGCH